MARDAPADTAGPSSPPPRLPEGWLPQWEGVQRKWYYVQRTTGKSQWEIPTEPVVLTPSTTPTSIGTGPSQAPPSRPSTNSPQVGQGNTLVGRMTSLADRTRISSSLDAQFDGQSPNPTHKSSETGWYANQTEQHLPYNYGQQFAPALGGYGTESQDRGSSENSGMGATGVYSSHPQQALGQQAFGQPYSGTHWGSSGDAAHDQSGSFNPQHISDPYRGHASGPMSFLQHSSHGISAGYIPNLRSEHHPPEHQWQMSQQPMLSNPASQWTGSSNLSQPFFGSQCAPQAIMHSAGNMASLPSHFSNPSMPSSESSGSRPGPESMHSQQGTSVHQQGFLDPATMAHPPHGYQSQPSSSHGQYHSISMARAQSGPGFGSLRFPATPDAHGNAHQYQNPLVQVGAQQYLPQQHASHHSAAPQYPSGTSTARHNQQSAAPVSSRIATSDPQFVSGPWASSTATPPTSGQNQPSQQG